MCRGPAQSNGVLSLIDPELSLFSEHAEDFAAVGATVIGSSYELCEMSFDKMAMYKWLSSHGYRCARSWNDLEAFMSELEVGNVDFPVFVKPVRGSASVAISKVFDRETIELLWSHTDGLMVQEYLCGQEVGADVYIDMISGEVVSIFTKRKLRMRVGETDKSVSFRDEGLFAFIGQFAAEAGYRGQIDIDLFDVGGEWYVSEVNPRFGGGYPHAYECGCDHMALIANNLEGRANEPCVGVYDEVVYMMKYNEVSIRCAGSCPQDVSATSDATELVERDVGLREAPQAKKRLGGGRSVELKRQCVKIRAMVLAACTAYVYP